MTNMQRSIVLWVVVGAALIAVVVSAFAAAPPPFTAVVHQESDLRGYTTTAQDQMQTTSAVRTTTTTLAADDWAFDLNKMTYGDLARLPNITDELIDDILEYSATHVYYSVYDLKNVKGVTDQRLKSWLPHIYLSAFGMVSKETSE